MAKTQSDILILIEQLRQDPPSEQRTNLLAEVQQKPAKAVNVLTSDVALTASEIVALTTAALRMRRREDSRTVKHGSLAVLKRLRDANPPPELRQKFVELVCIHLNWRSLEHIFWNLEDYFPESSPITTEERQLLIRASIKKFPRHSFAYDEWLVIKNIRI